MTRAMTVKAIAPWFGGKRTMAPLIVQQLGKHAQYFEPFCGSMAVLFAKEVSRQETVNDLHKDLTNLAWVLQDPDAAESLYGRLQRVVFCEDILDEAGLQLERPAPHRNIPIDPDGPQVQRAYWYFLASWMMRNGIAGTARMEYQVAVRWTKGGGSPTIRFRSAIESIPAWHERLRNVVIINRDAFKIVGKFEDVAETAIYADPPYFSGSRSGFGNHGNGSKYLHEFVHGDHAFEPFLLNPERCLRCDRAKDEHKDHHERLRDVLVAYKKARVVVSYYDCPEIRELYRGWTFIDCARQKNLHAQNGRGARPKDAPELLIVNGPAY